jgi:hypothetical protein
MGRLYSRFWVGVTLVLSAVFVVLFFPIVQDRYGFAASVLLTAVGLLVIWASYLVRAHIFTRGEKNGSDGNRGKAGS